MLKKLFRLFAGGRVRPEIVFTCRGIKSELVINASDQRVLAGDYDDVLSVPGARITATSWRTWSITTVNYTRTLSRIHNQLLSQVKK
ncbi:hypothetical protein AAHU71_02280 [Klebsiella pneumoniae]|nr:hypothetical protein [Klebsiella pneumoniae]